MIRLRAVFFRFAKHSSLLVRCGAGTFAIASAACAIGADVKAPRLEVLETQHDFGTVPQGEICRHDFKIKNAGDAPLEITDVKPSCGCTTPGEWTRAIAPGGTGTIPIQFDSAHFVGPVVKTIDIASNDPAQRHAKVEIKALIWTPVQVATPVIIFPASTNPDEVLTRSTTIRNEAEGTLALTALKNDNPLFQPALKEIVPGKEFELTVTTKPPLPEGTHVAHMTMTSSNPKMPHVAVQAVVTVLPPVQVAPSSVTLPAGRLAAPEKRYVVVLNHRGAPLEVSDLAVNARGVETATQVAPDRKQFTITLTFPAGFELPAGEKVFLRGKTSHPSLPTFEVPVVPSVAR